MDKGLPAHCTGSKAEVVIAIPSLQNTTRRMYLSYTFQQIYNQWLQKSLKRWIQNKEKAIYRSQLIFVEDKKGVLSEI